jgi:hypothetical protein
MMKHIKPIVGILSILIAVSGCSSFDKNSALVPKDAAFVVHLNSNSLSSKLSWDDIKKTSWFTRMTSNETDSLKKKILEDPANSGVDTKQGFYAFARRISNGPSYFGFTGTIKDAAAFEAFNKKAIGSNDVINKDNLKTILFKDKAAVTWNNNKFLYLAQNDMPQFHKLDSNHTNQAPQPIDFHETARRIFNYKKDSLLIDDDRFAALMKDNGDVHFWTNAESFSEDNPLLGMLSMLRTEVYFHETVSAVTVTFENGKITAHARMYSNKDMREIMKKYSGNNINADMVKRIPSDNVIGVLAANYKPEGIKEFLKLGGLDGFINSSLGEYNLTLDQVLAATKGDLLVSVSDVGTKKKMMSLGPGMDSMPISKPTGNILVAMSVTDKAPFQKLVDAGQKLNESGGFPLDVTLKLNNDFFVAGTNAVFVDDFLKGGSHNFPFLSKISGHPIAFYLDLQKLMSSFGNDGDSTEGGLMNTSAQMWKDVVVTGGEFKDDAIHEDVEVNLIDQNTNSLQQLNSYFDKLSSGRKKPF